MPMSPTTRPSMRLDCSTAQQMSISFSVAAAGLTTTFFIPNSANSNSGEMIYGIHEAFLLLGGFTILSRIVFHRLKRDDGSNESRQKDHHLA